MRNGKSVCMYGTGTPRSIETFGACSELGDRGVYRILTYTIKMKYSPGALMLLALDQKGGIQSHNHQPSDHHGTSNQLLHQTDRRALKSK